ncbi:MAG: hypothetical protein H6Q61_1088 [Firmicutes bacterium]|nr:hypothetical protein [Bacillota bacterium]
MRSVSFTTTVRIREPQSKIVDLDAYRRELTRDNAAESAALDSTSTSEKGTGHSNSLRRKLQDLALILEICVGFSMLVLIFVTLFRVLL